MQVSVEQHADRELEKSGSLTTARIQSLGDNIFGFAMTLLVLNFFAPSLANGNPLGAELQSLGLTLVTYSMSFIVLGIMWVSQQNQYHFIEHTDRLFLWINIFFLMCVVFVPFSTHVLALYYTDPLAVFLYGGNLVLSGILLCVHWLYATHNHRLVAKDLSDRIIHVISFRFFLIISWVSMAVMVSFISVQAAFFLFVPAIILGMMPTIMDRLAHQWLG